MLYMTADGWIWTPLVFAWNCFIKPFLHSPSTSERGDQQGRLDAFYQGQAHVYDKTRTHLLKGRETMLQLLAAHLKALPRSTGTGGRGTKPRIWVDIGGGTGWNVEKMYVVYTICFTILQVVSARGDYADLR
jgi:betaine lipid synthase